MRKLTEKAGIVRSTFYTYYDNLTQLEIDIQNEFNHRLRDQIEPYLVNIQVFADPLMLQALLTHLADGYGQFQFLCRNYSNHSFLVKFSHTLKEIFSKRLDYLKIPYNEIRMDFVIYGLVSILDYLNHGKTVADLTEEYVNILNGIFKTT